MAISVKGVARRQGVSGGFNVRSTFPGSSSLRSTLQALTRTEVSFGVSECIYGWTAAFEQTWSHIRVRIRLNADAGITAATINNLQATWGNGIQGTWSNQWGLGRQGEATCPLTFEVQWVNTNEHHAVRVLPGPMHSNLGTWNTLDTGLVAAHEFGHMLGNPDEYAEPNCPDRNPVNTGTIMDNLSNIIPERMMRRFADNIGSSIVPL